jgi:hypothetical protein
MFVLDVSNFCCCHNQVCRIRTGSLVQHGVQVKYCHACCGRPLIGQAVPNIWMCNFCRQTCDIKDTVLTFFFTALLVDTYPGQKTQLYATCSGQAAREILQAEPEAFCALSEVCYIFVSLPWIVDL